MYHDFVIASLGASDLLPLEAVLIIHFFDGL